MEPLLLGMLNTPEIILLLVLALILFGAKKLPELAKGLGHGIKEFRKASREISDELNSAVQEEPPPPRRSSPPTAPVTAPAGAEPQTPPAAADPSGEEGSESPPAAESQDAESAPPIPKP